MKRLVILLAAAALCWSANAWAFKEYKGWKAEVEQKLAKGDFAGAMTQLKAVEQGGTELDADYWFLMGKAHSSVGDTDQAMSCIDKAIALEPTFAEAIGHKALLLLQKQRVAEAEETATKAIGIEASGELHYARGAIRMAQGRFEDAIKDLSSAITLEPKNAEYYIARGEVRLRVGRPAEALADYEEAIKADSANAKAYLGRGGVYMLQGKYADARLDLDKCAELAPKFSSCYVRRGKLFQLSGELDRSVDDFRRGTDLAPDSTEAWFERAMTELQDQRLDDAESSAGKLLALADDAKSHKVLGMVLAARKKMDASIAQFTKAIDKEPKDFESYYLRGNLYALQNDFDKAMADFDKSIAIESRYLDPYVAKANVYMAQKDLNGALNACNTAISVAPKNPDLYQMRSQVYQAMSEYDKSMEDFKKYKELLAAMREQQ